MQTTAKEHGKSIYEALMQEHRARIDRERKRAEYGFMARRKHIEAIGLPEVRNHRLRLLAQEERAFQQQLEQKGEAYPEMVPLLMVRVEGGSDE
jgi:hypothetical protein